MALDAELLVDHEIGVRERFLQVAHLDHQVPGDIGAGLRTEQHGASGDSLVGVEYGWELLVVDVQQLGCVFGQVARLSDHDCDRLAGIPHHAVRQRSLQETP